MQYTATTHLTLKSWRKNKKDSTMFEVGGLKEETNKENWLIEFRMSRSSKIQPPKVSPSLGINSWRLQSKPLWRTKGFKVGSWLSWGCGGFHVLFVAIIRRFHSVINPKRGWAEVTGKAQKKWKKSKHWIATDPTKIHDPTILTIPLWSCTTCDFDYNSDRFIKMGT